MIQAQELSRPLKIWLGGLLVALWSSALFESGLTFFAQRMGITVFRLSGGLFLASAVLLFLGKARPVGLTFFKRHTLLLLLYACYWLIAWVGALYSPATGVAWVAVTEQVWYAALTVVSILVLNLFSLSERRHILALAGLAALLVLAYFSAIILITGIDPVARSQFGISAFRDYNVFSRSLLFGALLLFLAKDTFAHVSTVRFLAYAGLIALITTVAVFSGSRRAIAAYSPIAVGVPLILLLARSPRRFLCVLACGVMLALAGWGLFEADVIHRQAIVEALEARLGKTAVEQLDNRIERGLGFVTGERADIDSRLWRWQAAWRILNNYPWQKLGVGGGTRSFEQEASLEYTYPHNFLLSAMLEGGILKLGVLLLFIAVWTRQVLLGAFRQSFWLANFLLVASAVWLVTVSISTEEFFSSRQFLLILVVYAAFWQHSATNKRLNPTERPSQEATGETSDL
ncbi:MAG: O-antigen ligase family protein [Chloroflexota bacterium]